MGFEVRRSELPKSNSVNNEAVWDFLDTFFFLPLVNVVSNLYL